MRCQRLEHKNSRILKLAKAAANEYHNMSNPFATDWITKNNVTLDECRNLSDYIGDAIETHTNLFRLLGGDKNE